MSALAGSGALVRLILWRDRWLLALWVVLPALYAAYAVSFTESTNPTAADRLAYVTEINANSGFLMLYGRAFGSSVGALSTWRAGDILWIVALASLLTVIRHTRAEEEAGRRELLGAAAVGRHAGLAAALIVVLGANAVLAALIALGMVSQGIPAAGSVALGLKVAAVGWVFAAMAAVVAQLTESARAARGVAVATLGATFVLRALGDSAGGGGASWLSWLSPFGWAHEIRPYAGERWWILAPAAGFVVALAAAAVVLASRRDVGAGVVRRQLGPADGSPALRSPLALAWRLHRGPLLAWTIGFVVLGAVWGGAAEGAGDLFRSSQQVGELFERLGGNAAPSDIFLSGMMSIFGLIAAAYAVQAALRLRSEEEGQRTEPLLATAVARVQWASSHLVFALAGPAVALAAAGLAGGLVYGLSVDDVAGELPRVVAGAIAQLPAVWVLAGVTLALFGLRPGLAWAGWAALAVFALLGQLGAMLDLSDTLLDVSPFTHIPKLPGGEATVTPLVWLVALTGALVLAGLAGFRRRDVPSG